MRVEIQLLNIRLWICAGGGLPAGVRDSAAEGAVEVGGRHSGQPPSQRQGHEVAASERRPG